MHKGLFMFQLKRLMFTFLLLLMSVSLSAEQATWSGKWHVFWKHGTIILTMEQHGNDVNGSYEPNNGTLWGTIKGKKLYATTKNPDGQEEITITQGENGNSLFGNNIYGDWITGIRVDENNKFPGNLSAVGIAAQETTEEPVKPSEEDKEATE